MSVTTVGTAHTHFNAGVTISVTLPTGIQANDLIFLYLGTNASGGTISATGYTLAHEGGETFGLTSALLWKVAAGTEGGTSVTIAHSTGSIDGAAGAIVLRGVDTTTPVLGFSANVNMGSTSNATGTVSWSGATNAVSMLCFTWQTGSTTATVPSGWNASPDGWTDNDTFEYSEVACNLTTVSGVTSLASQNVTFASAPYGALNQYALKVAAAGASAVWMPQPVTYRRRVVRSTPPRGPLQVPPPQVPVPVKAPQVIRSTPRPEMARRGRQVTPIPAQATVPPPSYPWAKLGAARRLIGRARAQQVSPVPPQIAVPKPVVSIRTIPRRVVAAARGHQPNSATLSGLSPINPPIIYSPLSSAVTRARKALRTKGHKAEPPWPTQTQPPTFVSPKLGATRRLIGRARSRQVAPVPPQQTVAPPSYPPRKLGARRILSAPGRARHPTPVPAQIPVPKLAPRVIRSIPRPALLRRGRRAEPGWPQATPTFAPTVCYPTSALIVPYVSASTIAPHDAAIGFVPYATSGGIAPHDTTPTLAPHETMGMIAPRETGAEIADYQSGVTHFNTCDD